VKADLFKQARERLSIADAWAMLGLQGEPKSSCRSPFREERSPSFTIYDNGTKWKDHGEQLGGDVVEFIKQALGSDYKEVREWLQDRLGLIPAPSTTRKAPSPPKAIQYPAAFTESTVERLAAMADAKGLQAETIRFLVHHGMIRFITIKGAECYLVTDRQNRNAEIRRLDAQPFFHGKKAYPLAGVDKSWLIGADYLRDHPKANVLLVEGATDFLTAWDMATAYAGNKDSEESAWVPLALLGASCKAIHSECLKILQGRHVRLVPDGDEAGDKMRAHWTASLSANGCCIDSIIMPRGKDLTDIKSQLQPHDLFSL
jgi:DNA primase